MRISDWSSDVCSSDLTTSTTWSSLPPLAGPVTGTKVGSSAMGVTIDEILVGDPREAWEAAGFTVDPDGTCRIGTVKVRLVGRDGRSEEHTSELQSLMRISYAVFCLKKKKDIPNHTP